MAILGCGAELAEVMKVWDDDVQSIEDALADRMGIGQDRKTAQRDAVADVLAELKAERAEIFKLVQEQHPIEQAAPQSKAAPKPATATQLTKIRQAND